MALVTATDLVGQDLVKSRFVPEPLGGAYGAPVESVRAAVPDLYLAQWLWYDGAYSRPLRLKRYQRCRAPTFLRFTPLVLCQLTRSIQGFGVELSYKPSADHLVALEGSGAALPAFSEVAK